MHTSSSLLTTTSGGSLQESSASRSSSSSDRTPSGAFTPSLNSSSIVPLSSSHGLTGLPQRSNTTSHQKPPSTLTSPISGITNSSSLAFPTQSAKTTRFPLGSNGFGASSRQRNSSSTGVLTPFPITAGVHFNNLINAPTGSRSNLTNTNATAAFNSSLFSSCASAYEYYYTNLQHAWVNTLPFSLTYSRPPQCEKVLANYCLIWLDGIDLLYFPTPYADGATPATTQAPNKSEASVLVSDGYSFTPGSAYFVYKNAKAILPYNTLKSTTGPFYSSLTIGYPDQSVSTFLDCSPGAFWPYKTVNFEDFNSPPKWSIVSQQRSCHVWSLEGDSLQHQTFPSSEIAWQYTLYSNKPLVLLPGPLTDVDPTWRSCSMGDAGLGLYDPPRPLEPGNGLVPVTTDSAPAPALAEQTAQPASGVAVPGPAQTGITVHLPNGDTVIDYPPPGASLNVPSRSGSTASSTGLFVANRPQPFNPKAPAVPAGEKPDGISGDGGKAVAAGGETGESTGSSNEVKSPIQDFPNKEDGDVIDSENGDLDSTSLPSDSSVQVPSGKEAPVSGNPPIQANSPAVNTGGHTVQAAPNGGIVIDGQTLDHTHPSGTVGGLPASLQSSGVVIGGKMISVPAAEPGTPPTPISVNGHAILLNKDNPEAQQLEVDGKPLPAGISQTQVGGNVISILSNGQLSVLPITLPYVPLATDTSKTTGGDTSTEALKPYRLPNGAVEVAGVTLTAGASPTTISGTPVSVISGGEGVVIGKQTIQPIPTPPPFHEPLAGLAMIVNGETVTPVGNNQVVLDGTTLSKNGQQLTFRDDKVASIVDGNVVIGDKSLPIPAAVSTPNAQRPVVVDGQIFTPLVGGGVAVNGVTLSRSAQMYTLPDGRVASLKDGDLVVGSQTIPLASPTLSVSYQNNGLVVEGETFLPVGTSAVVVDGTTLSKPGQMVTLPGGAVATFTNGGLMVGSQVISLPPVTQPGVGQWVMDGLTKGSVKTLSNGDLIYDGTTVRPGGPAVTLPDGEVVSLEPSGALFDFSGTAVPRIPATATGSTATPTPTSSLTAPGQDQGSGGGGRPNGAVTASSPPTLLVLSTLIICIFMGLAGIL